MDVNQSSRKNSGLRALPRLRLMKLRLVGWLAALSLMPVAALAQAGAPLVSGQKPGSILVFPLYTSSVYYANAENTRISITNVSETNAAYLHLFFVDGDSCAPADTFACLTPQQTLSFLLSDYDPNTFGYLVVIAVNRQGCPISFNHLIGDAYVKILSGHMANYGAEAFAALWRDQNGNYTDGTVLPGCTATSVTATLRLDGSAMGYDAAPRELAVDGLTSPADGGNSLLVVTRAGGDLTARGSLIGRLQGVLFDEVESPFSFISTLGEANCQFHVIISDFFPRTVPRYSVIVRRGRIGWLKFWSANRTGLLGLVLHNTYGDRPAGRTLHKLSTTTDSYLMPIFIPPC